MLGYWNSKDNLSQRHRDHGEGGNVGGQKARRLNALEGNPVQLGRKVGRLEGEDMEGTEW
ncbi:MAG: hypothetical protein KAS66_03230 [Candidatus Omnitrophica bacterium]|nr:hypothetical protein [Candidatus Omnitrophota bacterium]